MTKPLTPKQLARAIDVSESSVKRWCDQGVITTEYTAGGHRRIPISVAIEFVRNHNQTIANPEILGLPVTSGKTSRVTRRATQQLTEKLLAGEPDQCRRILYDLYLAGQSIASICDQVMAASFREIGDAWECGAADVYQERVGCEITLRFLRELRATTPPPPKSAPVAIGGTPAGDYYQIPAAMADLVLYNLGWNSVPLGTNLPFATLKAAVDNYQPQFIWLSVSHVAEKETFEVEFKAFAKSIKDAKLAFGGRAFADINLDGLENGTFCSSIEQLEVFANSLHLHNLSN
jgi:methanogenic corrinoid protein MtbC1